MKISGSKMLALFKIVRDSKFSNNTENSIPNFAQANILTKDSFDADECIIILLILFLDAKCCIIFQRTTQERRFHCSYN